MRMKKKKHGSERLNLLSALMVTDIKEFYEKRNEIFGNDKPLRIEIGCGKGDFVCGKSEQESEYNYLAIEKIADVCTLAVENYAVKKGLGSLAPNGGWQKPNGEIYRLGEVVPFDGEELGNVRFMVGDAKELLVNLPDNAVDAVYVNFCDPWSKKGHTKRRLTYIEFLKMYSRVLKPDGKLYFKTDNRPLFDFAVEQLEPAGWRALEITYDLHHDEKMMQGNIMTEYEEKFSSIGNPIHKYIICR